MSAGASGAASRGGPCFTCWTPAGILQAAVCNPGAAVAATLGLVYNAAAVGDGPRWLYLTLSVDGYRRRIAQFDRGQAAEPGIASTGSTDRQRLDRRRRRFTRRTDHARQGPRAGRRDTGCHVPVATVGAGCTQPGGGYRVVSLALYQPVPRRRYGRVRHLSCCADTRRPGVGGHTTSLWATRVMRWSTTPLQLPGVGCG